MDSLTHILNAETSLKRIVEDLDTMSEGQSGALLLIDIDKFKLINDNYGHLEGDSILKQFALLLRDSFRSEDIVGRPGGDEFIVYMKAVNDRKIFARQMQCALSCRKPDSHKRTKEYYNQCRSGACFARPVLF